ncbi:MAG: hypothetical protein K2Q14_01945 [Gammaproteobacteria bacterium]|nr:hypothetical protein [Gammaproteobacteria bacterium]
MAHNNVSEFPRSASQTSEPITLDKVVLAMANWRTNKKSPQEPIPESIWQQVFVLGPTLRALRWGAIKIHFLCKKMLFW